MYRACIFCSAHLGTNDVVERFPVGRSLAFDGEKGRLWAVCGKCARWNLAPIEERWEAIEEAERLFRDTRLRVQSENIGLAKLRDGTRLIRVGQALPGELAAWRYGETLVQRRRRHAVTGAAVALVGGAGALAGVAGAGFSVISGIFIYRSVHHLWRQRREMRVVYRVRRPSDERQVITVRRRDLASARLVEGPDGALGIGFDDPGEPRVDGNPGFGYVPRVPQMVLTGQPARTLLGRAMVHVNDRGARREAVDAALRRIAEDGSPHEFLRSAAHRKRRLLNDSTGDLALEMALHEEAERRALDGELAALQAMWRQAEEIASIADALPDLPAPEPPRLREG